MSCFVCLKTESHNSTIYPTGCNCGQLVHVFCLREYNESKYRYNRSITKCSICDKSYNQQLIKIIKKHKKEYKNYMYRWDPERAEKEEHDSRNRLIFSTCTTILLLSIYFGVGLTSLKDEAQFIFMLFGGICIFIPILFTWVYWCANGEL